MSVLFDFGSLKKEKLKIKKVSGSIPPKKSVIKKVHKTSSLDKTDQLILELLAMKFKNEGTNVLGPVKPKNPFLGYFSKMAYLVQSKQIFELMEESDILEKTKYHSQYRIK